MKKSMLLTILVLFQFTGILFTQTEKVEKMKIVYKGAKIEFQNFENGIVEYVYDIEENNPYKSEPYPKYENNLSYDMTGITLESFLPNISQYDQETVARLNRSINYASISGTPYRKSLKKVSISYDFIVWNRNNGFVYAKSTIVVLNSKGEITHTFDPNFSVAMQAITNDGKYLCVAYLHTDKAITEEKGIGIRIYDLENNIVLSDKWNEKQFSHVSIKHGMCFFVGDNFNEEEGRTTCYLLYDFNKKKTYAKEFNWEKRCKLKRINNDRFIFGGSIEDVFYEEDFEVEDF